ncbi:unnamed protein product, partial [Rodentolepis nana]|uniref:non-specific serine/threonine protein kinase n=1 Tax=Rodentolepis nana TaxID=102285 RepID=A0A0R3TCZ6_RODNA
MSHRGKLRGDVEDSYRHVSLDKRSYFCKHQYKLGRMVGRGGSGCVYESECGSDKRKVAIKVFKKGSDRELIENEIKVLLHLQGLPNIVRFMGMPRKSLTEGPALVLEYVDPRGFHKVAKSTDPQEITFYMRELLIALDSCHTREIFPKSPRGTASLKAIIKLNDSPVLEALQIYNDYSYEPSVSPVHVCKNDCFWFYYTFKLRDTRTGGFHSIGISWSSSAENP